MHGIQKVSSYPTYLFAFTAIAFVVLCFSIQAKAERRVALVVGNGGYQAVSQLDNPVNDAKDISTTLKELGFEVTLALDLEKKRFEVEIESFARKVKNSDVAAFFFAGHAFQLGGENYLAPIDLGVIGEIPLNQQTISISRIYASLDHARKVKLVFLDACRNNPLSLGIADVGSGLARNPATASGYFISYATEPGNVALDGDGENSPYTASLVSRLATPGQSISDTMISVRQDVIKTTQGQQVPWESSSLTAPFQFNEGAETIPLDAQLYQLAVRTKSASISRLYLERYPSGTFANDVMDLLSKIGAENNSTEEIPEDDSNNIWSLARQTKLRGLADIYLQVNPNGPHSKEAKNLIERLDYVYNQSVGRNCERLATHPNDATAFTGGVPFQNLKRNADFAVKTCQAAAAEFPDQPRFKSLLARSLAAAGRSNDAIGLYKEAARAGDARALFSLGLLDERQGNFKAAFELYSKAGELGSIDGMINTATMLIEGTGVNANLAAGLSTLEKAAELGSGLALYNLGVISMRGENQDPTKAVELFENAARFGEVRGFRAAAALLDEGSASAGFQADPSKAASLLLRGLATDSGKIIEGIQNGNDRWSARTIRAMQGALRSRDLYPGTIDGIPGPIFFDSLRAWRNGGFKR